MRAARWAFAATLAAGALFVATRLAEIQRKYSR